MRMRIKFQIMLMLLVSSLGVNCFSDEQQPSQTETSSTESNNSVKESSNNQKEDVNTSTFGFNENPGLPTSSTTSNCAEIPEKLMPCEWFAISDAVVFGEIIDLKISNSPVEMMDGSKTIAENCETGVIDPAMIITLSVDTSLKGDFSTGDVIDIHIGSGELSEWNPTITKDAQGEYDWNKSGGLAVGQKIGSPVTYNAILGHWSNAMELMFVIDSNGVIQLQGHQEDSCTKNIPSGIEAINLDMAQEIVNMCDFSTVSTDRKQEKLSVWTNDPSHVSIAKCHRRLP